MGKHIDLPNLKNYGEIVVVVDRDTAGNYAGVALMGTIRAQHPFVSLIQTEERDCNDIYAQEGAEALREEICKRMRTKL